MYFNKYINMDKTINHRISYCVCGFYYKKKMCMNLTWNREYTHYFKYISIFQYLSISIRICIKTCLKNVNKYFVSVSSVIENTTIVRRFIYNITEL